VARYICVALPATKTMPCPLLPGRRKNWFQGLEDWWVGEEGARKGSALV
jgi:hypothetical protein